MVAAVHGTKAYFSTDRITPVALGVISWQGDWEPPGLRSLFRV